MLKACYQLASWKPEEEKSNVDYFRSRDRLETMRYTFLRSTVSRVFAEINIRKKWKHLFPPQQWGTGITPFEDALMVTALIGNSWADLHPSV
jgi:hypothetical protein